MADNIPDIARKIEDLDVKIINLGKRIDSLERTTGKVVGALENIPEAIAGVIDKNLTNFTLDAIKEDLDELKLTTNDIQRETTFLTEALTRKKMKVR